MQQFETGTIQRDDAIETVIAQLDEVVQKYRPQKIILFGSYASGTSTRDSDIDLLIILDTHRKTWDIAVEISLMFKHSLPMDIIVRTPQEIVKRLDDGDFFIKDIIENGKVIYEQTG